MRFPASRLQDVLILLRQLLPLAHVDESIELGPAFPPARVVVVLADLVETELLVVIGADPFGRIDGPLLERRIDVARAELLRYRAHLGDHGPGESADAHLEALPIGRRLHLLAEPAAHLRAGVAAGDVVDAVALVELAQQLESAAEELPRGHLAGVEAEGNGGAQGKRGILAPIVVRRGVAALDGSALHVVEYLQGRNDLAAGE